MADITFLAWRRRGGSAIAAAGGRRPALQLTVTADDGRGPAVSGTPSLLLHGPGDVTGLQPGAVTAVFPRPGQVDVEPTFCPYAELAAPDLPWRYSPVGGSPDAMMPWLALLVGRLGGPVPEVELRGRTAVVQPAALPSPDEVARGAHVQRTPGAGGGHEVARLLCLRRLVGDLDGDGRDDLNPATYMALVVPVFGRDGLPRWDGGGAVVLPVFHQWTFQTGTAETFASLAQALHQADNIADFGTITLAVRGATAEARGALVAIHAPAPEPAPAAATTELEAVLAFDPHPAAEAHEHGFDPAGRRYVRPPEYGAAWLRDPLAGAAPDGWVDQVNRDLRHRAVAGLGVQAAVDLQDELTAAAVAQFGATAAANGRLGALVAGLRAATSLWDRRLPPKQPDRVRVLGVSASRIATIDDADPASGIQPLLHRQTGAGHTLPQALFSSAAGRVLRRRASRLRRTALDPGSVVATASQGRATVTRPDEAPDDPRQHDGVAHGDALVADLGGLRLRERDVTNGDELVAVVLQGDDVLDVELEPGRPAPSRTDLELLDKALRAAFDPRADPAAVRRVRATIEPDEAGLAPREPCPDLGLPAWAYLRDRQREWLLPGAHTLTDGEVVGLASNPAFVDALLLGMNTQTLGELRWRGLSVASGCTPLRRFWDAHQPADGAGYAEDTDIVGVRAWVGPDGAGGDRRSVALGAAAHGPRPPAPRAQLVVAFCTDLFRRYPSTLVYLAPQTAAGAWQDADLGAAVRHLPSFIARITPKLVLYGFALDPAVLDSLWVVVEQQPPGYRFDRQKLPAGPVRPAADAAAMLVRPVRVLLAGNLVAGAP